MLSERATLVIKRDNLSPFAQHLTPLPLALIHNEGLVQCLPTLRLLFDSGISNDYRVRQGIVVEFRTNKGPWRTLDESDLAIHFRFNTEVARWLRRHFVEKNPYRVMTG